MSALYSTLSAMEAIADSGLVPEDLSSERVACIVGSGVSNTEPIYQSRGKAFFRKWQNHALRGYQEHDQQL